MKMSVMLLLMTVVSHDHGDDCDGGKTMRKDCESEGPDSEIWVVLFFYDDNGHEDDYKMMMMKTKVKSMIRIWM